jgi:Phage integrase SAM-like domain
VGDLNPLSNTAQISLLSSPRIQHLRALCDIRHTNAKNTLSHLRRFLGSQTWFLHDITAMDLEQFQKYLLRKCLKRLSIPTMTVLKSAFVVARKEKLLGKRGTAALTSAVFSLPEEMCLGRILLQQFSVSLSH